MSLNVREPVARGGHPSLAAKGSAGNDLRGLGALVC